MSLRIYRGADFQVLCLRLMMRPVEKLESIYSVEILCVKGFLQLMSQHVYIHRRSFKNMQAGHQVNTTFKVEIQLGIKPLREHRDV